jgi:RHS repeat-associated protein
MSWIAVLSFILTAVLPLPALAGDAVFYYHNDTTGSPVAVTNSAGTKVWGADYEPFGELAGVVETVPNNQQFLAKTVDPETSLHLLGARYYDGKLGRFASIDQALLNGQPGSAVQYPQRLNFYGYSANNPYKHVDPTGRYLETGWDIISLGFSIQAYHADPSLLNALAVAYDTFALATPFIPAGAGVIIKGAGGLEKITDIGGGAGRISQAIANGGSSSSGAIARTFELGGKRVPVVGSNPEVGRTLKSGLQEIKTELKGGLDEATAVFRSLIGNSEVKSLGNGKGLRAVLDNGREVVFRSGSRSGIPKVEIRDSAAGISEKINFNK